MPEKTQKTPQGEWLKAVVAARLLAHILGVGEHGNPSCIHHGMGGQWGGAGTQRHQHSETQTHRHTDTPVPEVGLVYLILSPLSRCPSLSPLGTARTYPLKVSQFPQTQAPPLGIRLYIQVIIIISRCLLAWPTLLRALIGPLPLFLLLCHHMSHGNSHSGIFLVLKQP